MTKSTLVTNDDILAGLLAVRLLMDDPQTWTRGAYSRDDRGYAVGSPGRNAAKFCIMGAVYEIAPNINVAEAISREFAQVDSRTPTGINDREGRLAVVALVDRTLARVEARL